MRRNALSVAVRCLTFGAVLAVVSCRGRPAAQPAKAAPAPKGPASVSSAQSIGWVAIDEPDPRGLDLLRAPIPRLPGLVADLYRLKPDRRFLYAIGEIYQVSTGKTGGARLGIRFDTDRNVWRIRWDEREVGALSEYPSWAEGKSLLSAWAEALGPVSGAPAGGSRPAPSRAALSAGDVPQVFDALRRLNEDWKSAPGSSSTLADAARGLVWLTMQTPDALDTANPVEGSALALMVLAQRLAPGTLVADEALLASRFGYETAAASLAARLPAGSPERAYVESQPAGFEPTKGTRDSREEYLSLLSHAATSDPNALEERVRSSSWFERAGGLSMLRVAAAVEQMGIYYSANRALIAAVVEDLQPPQPSAGAVAPLAPSRPPPESDLQSVEKLIEARASTFANGLVDSDVVRSYYRATIYSAMYATIRYAFDYRSSEPEAAAYAASLTNPPAGFPSDLKKWTELRLRLRRGGADVGSVADEFSRLDSLGTAPLARARQSIDFYSYSFDPALRRPMPTYFRALDSRPAGLVEAAWASERNLTNLVLTEKLQAAAKQVCPRRLGRGLTTYLHRTRDWKSLREQVEDRRVTLTERASAWWYLFDEPEARTAALVARGAKLFEEDPADTGALGVYLSRVSKLDRRAALAGIDRWLALADARGAGMDLKRAWVLEQKADLLLAEGAPQKAWETIEPALETFKEDVLLMGVAVLERLGRLDEALALAKDCRERYRSDATGDCVVVRVLWRRGDDAGALQALRGASLRDEDWGTIAASFRSVFPEALRDRAVRVFHDVSALTSNCYSLARVPAAYCDAGEHETAFALLQAARTNTIRDTELILDQYDEVKHSKGDASARQWIEAERIFPIPATSWQAYQDRRFEIVWSGKQGEAPKPEDAMWVLRAAAFIHRGGSDPTERETLNTYFAGRPSALPVFVGRYLLGAASEDALHAARTDMSSLESIAWSHALRAASEGHGEEANRWLQVVFETRDAGRAPFNASTALYARWKIADRSLSALTPRELL